MSVQKMAYQGVPCLEIPENDRRKTADIGSQRCGKIIVTFQIETLARSPAPPIPRPPDRDSGARLIV